MWRPAVAVVDSIGELLPLHGLNSNSADEFTVVHSNVLKPLAKAGTAVLAVDHLAKSADSRAHGRVLLHENAVAVGGRTHVGTLKSGHSRTVALPAFVVDELAATCEGKDRDDVIWPARDGGYLAPPTNKSWLAGAVERCQKAD